MAEYPKKLNMALIGFPVAHSLSPRIYERLFSERGIDGAFTLLPIDKKGLPRIRETVARHNLNAFAVTMPHKRAILPFLDAQSEAASAAGSVNFVTVSGKGSGLRLSGHSTDGAGFLLGLEQNGIELCGKSVVIYGAGGAAAAIAHAIGQSAGEMRILARDAARAKALAEHVGAAHGAALRLPADCDIFINATPLGMSGHPRFESFEFLNALRKGAIVCDLVYEPRETELLKEAAKRGLHAQNGLPMLENQAAVAFEILLSAFRADA